MFDLPFKFPAGQLVVFEGLDDSGKSTQMERFEATCYRPEERGRPLYEPIPMFTHQPSGATGIGPDIYSLTEGVDWSKGSPLTRQLLHLAAHTEHYHHDIIPALKKQAVIMDRCWWSTMAYGYRGIIADNLSWEQFKTVCLLPTQGVMPSVVFLFTHRFGEKASQKTTSSDRTTFRNYLRLQGDYEVDTVLVPKLGVGETTAFISGELSKRGLVTVEEKN